MDSYRRDLILLEVSDGLETSTPDLSPLKLWVYLHLSWELGKA